MNFMLYEDLDETLIVCYKQEDNSFTLEFAMYTLLLFCYHKFKTISFSCTLFDC